MNTTRATLKSSLAAGYVRLRDKLTKRLGSQEIASEALHETWIKLNGVRDETPVDDAEAYIYRAAVNMATTLAAKSRRVLGNQDIEDILQVADEAPGPERITIARSEIAHVWKLLKKLTPRQRHVFIESFTGTMKQEALAEHHGVSVRQIQTDLRTALLLCTSRNNQKKASMTKKTFGPSPVHESSHTGEVKGE